MFKRSGRSYGNTSRTIADDRKRPGRSGRSRSGRSWKIRSDQMETLSDDRDDRDDRSLSQKASFPSPFFALSREDCLGVREFSPKWRQRRSSTLLYLWKRYRNTSACTTNFQRIIRTSYPKSVPSWYSSTSSTAQNWKNKQIARDEIRSSINIRHFVCESRAKVLLSGPGILLTTVSSHSLGRSRRSFGN